MRPVLVIDDDPRVCELVAVMLGQGDFEVLSASDGASGIELGRAAQPAVIILDMMMPGFDGIATCRQLKRDRIIGDVPVVGITAAPDATYTEQAFQAGAEFFLAKPIRANSLVQVVDLAAKKNKGSRGTRTFPRFAAEIPVRCIVRRDAETTRDVAGQTGNVSLEGLLLLLPESLPWGALVRMHLELPDKSVPADGVVMWQGPQPTTDARFRHGVRLLRFPDNAVLVHYRRYLSQLAERSLA